MHAPGARQGGGVAHGNAVHASWQLWGSPCALSRSLPACCYKAKLFVAQLDPLGLVKCCLWTSQDNNTLAEVAGVFLGDSDSGSRWVL